MNKKKIEYELKCIQEALVADRNLKLAVGLLAILGGTVLLFYYFQSAAWILSALALVSFLGGFRLLWGVFRYWHPSNMRLIRLLKYQPEEIVWVYSVTTQNLPFGIQISKKTTMYFWLMERDNITIRLKEKDLKSVALYLNHQLPHASFGFSQEKEQWYIANPALLLRD